MPFAKVFLDLSYPGLIMSSFAVLQRIALKHEPCICRLHKEPVQDCSTECNPCRHRQHRWISGNNTLICTRASHPVMAYSVCLLTLMEAATHPKAHLRPPIAPCKEPVSLNVTHTHTSKTPSMVKSATMTCNDMHVVTSLNQQYILTDMVQAELEKRLCLKTGLEMCSHCK